MRWRRCVRGLRQRRRLTRDGKLNSLRKPKSSPLARSFRSLLSDVALTKLSVGHIPSQVRPRTDVQLAQSSFSNCNRRQRVDGNVLTVMLTVTVTFR